MRKIIISIAIVVLLALGLGVGAGEAEEEHHGEHQEFEVLDRNIRLTFKLVDGDGRGDEGASIVTAIPKYKLAARLDRENEGGEMLIVGAVGPRNDGRILALMEVEIVLDDGAGETELAVECGVLLSPGKSSEVARWGERGLVLHAEYAD
jgi:hypothetical protein